jgi:DNA polymerase-3 subunit beta
MELLINRRTLADALQDLRAFAGKNKQLPILDNVKFVVKDNNVRLQTSDGTRAIRKYITADSSSEDGAFLVNCAALIGIISKISRETIMFQVEDSHVTVKYGSGKMKFAALPANDYPEPFVPSVGDRVDIPQNIFVNDVSTAQSFVGNDDYRPMMKNVYINVVDGTIEVTGTDTHMCYHSTHELQGNVPDVSFFIDPTLTSLIAKAARKVESVSVYISKEQYSFQTPDTIIFSAGYNYKFPNVKRIIPTENNIEVVVNKNTLDAVIGRVALACSESSMIKFTVDNNNMSVEADNLMASASESMTVGSTCSMVFGMHNSYFRTLLNATQSEDVTICLKDPSSAVLLKDENKERTLLIMPMSTQPV